MNPGEHVTTAAVGFGSPGAMSNRTGCALGGWPVPGFPRRPSPLAVAAPVGGRGLLFLTAALAAGLLLAAAHRWFSTPPAPGSDLPGFNLHADVSSSKLNTTGAGPPPRPAGPELSPEAKKPKGN